MALGAGLGDHGAMRAWPFAVLMSVLCGAGCARGAGGGVDSGPRPVLLDAGRDAAGLDAGPTTGPDAGPITGPDTGPTTSPDAGPVTGPDAGPTGSPDAGSPDAGGLCAGADCTPFDGQCVAGVCNPATGLCGTTPRPDGTTCSDGNACTTGDRCTAGTCGGAPVDCSAMTSACGTGVCSPTTGACTVSPAADGTSCGTPGGCTSSVCRTGACVTGPTADCGACGGGQVCVAGTCSAPPTALAYDFESGSLPAGWTVGAGSAAPWTVATGTAHGGTRAARSGVIGDSQESALAMSITLSNPTIFSFWLSTSSEGGFDFLELRVDGALVQSWSGAVAWQLHATRLAAGAHTIEWRYRKDGSIATGSDAVWIDDVTFAIDSSPNTGFEGSATLPAGYTTTAAPWTVTATMPRAGTRCAVSGTIPDNGTTSLSRTAWLGAASTLTFWYRVDSEGGWDYLGVYDNGTLLGNWSGAVPWTLASYPLTAGSHTIEWRYSKDGSVSTGADAAWIDDIDFGPGVTTAAGPVCGP